MTSFFMGWILSSFWFFSSLHYHQTIFSLVYNFYLWKNQYDASYLYYQNQDSKDLPFNCIFQQFSSVCLQLVFISVLQLGQFIFVGFVIIQMFSVAELILLKMALYTKLISFAESHFNKFSLIFRIISSNQRYYF